MQILDWLKAVLYGLVEGITEWLPISSTGHMILLNELLPFGSVSEGFWSVFEVVIQLGAILAVVIAFWRKIWPIGRSSQTGGLRWKKPILQLWLKVIVACLPAAVVGVLFDDVFERLFYNHVSVAAALIVFGIAFLVVEALWGGRKPRVTALSQLDYATVAVIGLCQVVAAVFPGASRSGMTILGALLLGVSRRVAVEFTFILAIPVMAGASLLKLVKYGFAFTGNEIAILLIGMVVAFAVSMLVIRLMLDYVRRHDFKPFGWYRIALGIVVLAYALLLRGH